ncbi:MAG: DUF3343 domain-containing protein [Firmicutes bacterium]|nr:DUF3343 domain-containing protein [Bacillota bacterium]
MRSEILITFRSITYAQRAEQLLNRGNISCVLQRTPKLLAQRGCGYCLRLNARFLERAVELLRRGDVPYQRIYPVDERSAPEGAAR